MCQFSYNYDINSVIWGFKTVCIKVKRADSDSLFLPIQRNSVPDVNTKPHEKEWDPSGYMGRLFDYFTVHCTWSLKPDFLSLIFITL